ncbi:MULTISPECIES: MFS transporter [Brevibacterium]|uniref:MFS transporter n=1 Tax=Brevibacterium casei TaxID=33889 RepID=A0A7T4DIY2_9MICO|nr:MULTISPECIES: MFS transporter [Brevibacterium]QQB13866.1 MFS transporter [Brevibacterium casei]
MGQRSTPGFAGVAGAGIYFSSNGAAFAALLPWYPLLITRLGLSAWEFGLVVASFAVGAIASSILPARLIGRFGANAVVVGGTVLLVAFVALTGWSTSGWMMAGCLFLVGVCDAIVDVAQNVVGIGVQENRSRIILSSMHALWSLGGLLSGALATAAAAAGMDIRLHLLLVAVGCLVLVIVGRWLIGGEGRQWGRHIIDDAEAARAPAPGPGRKRRILIAALPLAIVAVCGTAVEDIANNWAALAAVDIAGLPVTMAGIGFSIVIGSQCVGRFTGDVLVGRFGAGRIARLGGVLIALGGLGAATAVEPVQLLVSLAALGYGSATLVPGALSAASRLPGAGRAAGVTLVNWIMRIGFMATSPLVGVIATATNLRWGLGLLVVIGAATVVFAGRFDGERQRED